VNWHKPRDKKVLVSLLSATPELYMQFCHLRKEIAHYTDALKKLRTELRAIEVDFQRHTLTRGNLKERLHTSENALSSPAICDIVGVHRNNTLRQRVIWMATRQKINPDAGGKVGHLTARNKDESHKSIRTALAISL